MTGRNVFVTGGSGGIGRLCSEWFTARGDSVTVFDRKNGQDATQPDQVQAALKSLPSLDVVVHAVGTVQGGGIEDCSVDDWRRLLDDNLTSAFVVCQAALPKLSQGSSVVLFSSINGRHGGNRISGPAYAAAKAGIISLTRFLAKDLAKRGVRVNAIAPAGVLTPMLSRLSEEELDALRATIPLGRIVEADEVVGAVAWLCSHEARSVTGAVVDINGGSWVG